MYRLLIFNLNKQLKSNISERFFKVACKNITTENDIISSIKLSNRKSKTFDPHVASEIASNRCLSNPCIKSKIKDILECEDDEAAKIVELDNLFGKKSLPYIIDMVEFLNNVDISKASVLNNPFLLSLDKNLIKHKIHLIKNMKPRILDDFVPLMKLTLVDLAKLEKIMEREQDVIPGGNRIYFFSDKFNVPPQTVAKYFSTHIFMFEITLANLYRNLKVFLDYNVAPMNILRDLWAFKYKQKSIEKRLKRAKLAQKDKIMPWMVRCPEERLQKSLKLSTESKALLGNGETVVEYISNRLGYSFETTKYILSKHPSTLKVRITKVKEVLDYLLDEAGFTPHHIAQNPRILCHSLLTTKERLEELKKHGCIPTSLVIVCKSNREYQKFLQTWIECGNTIKKGMNV